MGGGSGDTETYDPLYNAGLLALAEEEQGWAEEYVNFYKYGVTYDPNETGYIDPTTKEFVPYDMTDKQIVLTNSDNGNNSYMTVYVDEDGVVQRDFFTAGTEFTTMGAAEGYDFENPPVSLMQLEQAQTADNMSLLSSTTAASEAQNIAETATSNLATTQAAAGQTAITGYDSQGNYIGPGSTAVTAAEQTRDISMLEADTRNVSYAEQAARNQYMLESDQAVADRSVIPYSRNAEASGYQYETAMNQAQQGLISPWVGSVLSEYGYTTAKNTAETELLPAYQQAMQSGYDLTTGQNLADQALLPYYQSAAQAGYQADEAGSIYSKGKSEADTALLPAYQKAAQAEYDLSYDTSTYGSQKIAAQTPIMQKYFDTVNKGVNVQGKVNEASADVAASWKGADQRTTMALEGMGVDPSSNRGRNAYSTSNMEYGRQQTSARQTARKDAESENLSRMETALNM